MKQDRHISTLSLYKALALSVLMFFAHANVVFLCGTWNDTILEYVLVMNTGSEENNEEEVKKQAVPFRNFINMDFKNTSRLLLVIYNKYLSDGYGQNHTPPPEVD